jgi:hypothetical protein
MQRNAGLFSQHVSSIIIPIFRSTLVSTSFWCPNLDQTSLFIFARFGHQKAVLTNVLLKMGIIMLETC